jgi:hypothetical protein
VDFHVIRLTDPLGVPLCYAAGRAQVARELVLSHSACGGVSQWRDARYKRGRFGFGGWTGRGKCPGDQVGRQ